MLPTVSLSSQARPGNPDGVGPFGSVASAQRAPSRPSMPRRSDPPGPRRPDLFVALIERQCDDFERLGFPAEIDVDEGAGLGELDVDVGHRHRVAEARAGLAGGHFADDVAVLEDRVVAAAGPAPKALEPDELAAGG
jgi:hypothetical protein